MFGFSLAELLLIALVALFVMGPQDLPRLMYQFGKLVRRVSYIRYAFSQQFEDFMVQAEKAERRKATGAVAPTAEQTGERPDEDEGHIGFAYATLPQEKAEPKAAEQEPKA